MNDNIVTTEDLILRLQAGDETALAPLMRCYNPQIWPMIRANCQNYQDAEDILSRTWQAVWKNIGGLQKVSGFGG